MHIHAPAKINWALNILGTRADGYHEMDMVMQSISLYDVLHIEHANNLSLNDGEDNLVLRAARALNEHAGTAHGARIRLEKRIPARAGLGGGSADAAATLIALNELWALGLPMAALLDIGLKLGADVPFCLMGSPMRARGLGEKLSPVHIVPTYELVLLHPGGGLSTPDMFRAWDAETAHSEPANIENTIAALMCGDTDALTGCARNMLYGCASTALREITAARNALLDEGARFAAMSGSGSAVFGVFDGAASADAAARSLGPTAFRAHTLSTREGK